jgi:ketosteroid isomerase-like protein
MSANLDLVRSIFTAWERGDYSEVAWADPDIEYVMADGPSPGTSTGLAGMAERARANLNAWEGVTIKAADYREVDAKRVLVRNHFTARGKRSGLEMGQIGTNGAHLFHIDDGKVTRLVVYYDDKQALADLGLKR